MVDDGGFLRDCAVTLLENMGIQQVELLPTAGAVLARLEFKAPDLVLCDIHLKEKGGSDGIGLVSQIRARGYNGPIVVLAKEPLKKRLYEVFQSGADDFLLKSEHLDFPEEVRRVLGRYQNGSKQPITWFRPLTESGFLRSTGLTSDELDLMDHFFRDNFPSQRELSKQRRKSASQLGKQFASIRRKLSVETPGQLAHVLTVCALLR